MKAIVTGGVGFIGSHLVDRLIDTGWDVIIIDKKDLTSKPRHVDVLNPKAKFLQLDITEMDPSSGVPVQLGGTDIIFHMAALARVQPSIDNPMVYHDTNINGTLNMLMIAKNLSVKRFVYSASSSCYGDTDIVPTPETAPKKPMSPYAMQKYVGEQYCELFSLIYGLDTVSLRYFNVYGNRMPTTGAYALVMAIFKKQAEEGLPLTITNDGNQRRDFTHVDDVVDANILAAEYEGNLDGAAFNIGNGSNHSINDVADMIGGEKQYGEKRFEPAETLANNTMAKKVLGWEPKGDLEKYIKENF